MEQLACVSCGSTVPAGDRFCVGCGTAAAGQWDDPGPAPAFFSHTAKQELPLSNTTRYLCAAAYLDRGFANKVILNLIATRRAVAPSVNFDLGPVLRHCLRAREMILARDCVLTVIVVAGLLINLWATVACLVLAFVLGLFLARGEHKGRGLVAKVRSSAVLLIGVVLGAVVLLFVAAQVFSSLLRSSSPYDGGSGGGVHLLSPLGVIVFLAVGAAAGTTQFAYVYGTFKTLDEHLRQGEAPPANKSRAREARIAEVEGAQCGNITLYDAEFPFIGAGPQTERHWSIAIRLTPANPLGRVVKGPRPKAEGHVRIDPVALHYRIRERLSGLNDPRLPENERVARLTVSDRLIGQGVLPWDSPLVDKDLKTTYSQASPEAILALIQHPQAGLRYYQQVSVNDEGPAVMVGQHKVIDSVDQGVVISAFVHAAVEGGMLYLQYVLTALPPILAEYRGIDFRKNLSPEQAYLRAAAYAAGSLFGTILTAPFGLLAAFSLWRDERRTEKEAMKEGESSVGAFGSLLSVRELGTAARFGSYLRRLDVEKYSQIISRLLLETVQEFLDDAEVDTSAFASSANSVINGDINYVANNSGQVGNVGSHHNGGH